MATLNLYHHEKEFVEKENRSEYFESRFASLLNIPGLTYAIGSKFPDEKENVEFMFHNWMEPTKGTQCCISVDNDGQFWISKGSILLSKTFLNWKEIDEPCPLKDNDSISFGFPRKYKEAWDCPIFRVELRQSNKKQHKKVISETSDPLNSLRSNPLNNELILYTIFGFLRVRNLKPCRLVSKKWDQEAKKLIEKWGKIRFDFQHDWRIPKNSMRVLKYLHELKHLKMMNLEIFLPKTGDNKRKPFCDFVKLFKSENNFTSLTITSPITDSESFSNLCRLLKSFDKKLVELKFCKKFQFTYLPENIVHPFGVALKGLKKLTDFGGYGFDDDDRTLTTWTSSLVPHISQTLESYSCDKYTIHINLKMILKSNILKHLTINCSFHAEHYQELFQFSGTLKSLVLQEVVIADQGIASQVTKFFERQANHLLTFKVHFHGDKEEIEIFFPPFPQLRELRLQYNRNVRIVWVGGETEYKCQFPLLKVLKVRKCRHENVSFHRTNGNGPFEWEKVGSTFNSFFSDHYGMIKSTTITKLVVPSLVDVIGISSEEYRRFHLRLLQFPLLFPNVKTKPKEGLGLTQTFVDSDSENENDADSPEYNDYYHSISSPGVQGQEIEWDRESAWDRDSNFGGPYDAYSVRSESSGDREEARSISNSESSREINYSPRSHISEEEENSGED